MSRHSGFLIAAAFFSLAHTQAYGFGAPNPHRTDSPVLNVKQPKCAAATVEDYEGTDMSGVTPKCESIFDACVNEKLDCKIRLQKCKEFDKMDRDGSCYKKR